MITKNDCLSILIKLEDSGITEAKQFTKKLFLAKEPPIDVLKFIASQRGLEVSNFYDMIRKNHNKKKSPLYTNIVRETSDIKTTVTTLSCLLTQILLYGSKLDNPTLFYREVRAEEISRVLNNYFKTNDFDSCQTMLRIVKSDLLVLEYIMGRRDLQ